MAYVPRQGDRADRAGSPSSVFCLTIASATRSSSADFGPGIIGWKSTSWEGKIASAPMSSARSNGPTVHSIAPIPCRSSATAIRFPARANGPGSSRFVGPARAWLGRISCLPPRPPHRLGVAPLRTTSEWGRRSLRGGTAQAARRRGSRSVSGRAVALGLLQVDPPEGDSADRRPLRPSLGTGSRSPTGRHHPRPRRAADTGRSSPFCAHRPPLVGR